MEENNHATLLLEDLIIRRSDLDDAVSIEALITQQDKRSLDLLYNYPKVLKLMETSYLSITVLDHEENILGCLIFDSHPEIITGMNDFLHENLWEDWMYTVFQFDQQCTPYNALWLKYVFLAHSAENMDDEMELNIIKKTFKYVYNTAPEKQYLMYHLRKEASSSRIAKDYVKILLGNLFGELQQRDLPAEKRGNINMSSEIYLSDRSQIIDVLEIREALEQDHDDLVDVCNGQSELNTGVYGEFFIAELIANQTSQKKAIVAQVGKKAVGLMSQTTDIDYNIQAKNFELETFDNLFNSEFMDAIKHRRMELEIEDQMKKEEEAKALKKKVMEETLRCHTTALRMSLQQYCIDNDEKIKNEIQEYLDNEEIQKKLNKDKVGLMIDNWLKDYKITQPSDFFQEYPEIDPNIYSHIISERDLLLQTLVYFNLPTGYMDGEGQWKDWEKKKREEKQQANRRKGPIHKKKAVTKGRRRGGKGTEEEDADMKPPSWFDLTPFLESFKKFCASSSQVRTMIRTELEKREKIVRMLFCHDSGEPNTERCQDILTLAEKLNTEFGFEFDEESVAVFGNIQDCFGDCQFTKCIIQVKEKPKEESKEIAALKSRVKMLSQKDEPEKMIDQTIKITSYDEFKGALDQIKLFDETQCELGYIKSDLLKKYITEKAQTEADNWETISKSRKLPPPDNIYFEYIKNQDEDTMMLNVPDEAKNAICINIFFIDQNLECRAIDFLPFAFDLFPDKEYIILTQPHTVEESVLLQSFIQVPKAQDTNFEHVLYIFNRVNLLAPYISIRRSVKEDLDDGEYQLENTINRPEMEADIDDGITNNASNKLCYTAFSEDSVIGFFVITKDVNFDYYKSHFCQQYHMLLDQYAIMDHTRLLHSIVNPLFQKGKRFMTREIQRLSNKKTLFFETHDDTVLLDTFCDQVLVRRRKFPHFQERKWDLEKDEEYLEKARDPVPSQDKYRNPLDESESLFALSMVTKKMLSINKTNNNTRIVVVGASDTGISLIETLLSIKYINFTNISLLAPGGLVNMHVKEPFSQLRSSR